MDEWNLSIIRAAVLHDLAKCLPEYYQSNALSGILQAKADWNVGSKLPGINPSMTMRQRSASQILSFIGLYRATVFAVAHCESLRKKLPNEQADIEDAYNKMTEWTDLSKGKLQESLRKYAKLLSSNEAQLLPLAETAPDDTENRVESSNDTSHEDITLANADDLEVQLQELFDPMPREGVAILFDKIDKETWKKLFTRGASNGLKDARHNGSLRLYNLYRVAQWLIKKGIYTQEETERKLANNLPRRSKDMKFLLTGTLD